MLLKFAILVLKSLGRNKLRTALTGLGVMVLVAIYAVVTNVTGTLKNKIAQNDQTRLIVSERWTMPSRVPARYVPDITGQDGVTDWTTVNFFPGFLDESRRRDRQAICIVTRPENLREMQSGLENLDPAVVDALVQRKDGAIVGPGLIKTMGWEVGQKFTLLAARFPPVDVQFTIVGVLPVGEMANGFYARHDYYREATKDHEAVNFVMLKVESSERARELAAQLSLDYENRQPALKIETESAGVARLASRGQAVLQIIDLVVAILLIDMVIILSNSISISVRERRVEMAVLKVLGFQPLHITLMIIAEAMLVGGIAGFVGTAFVSLLSQMTIAGTLPLYAWNKFLLQFPVPWSAALWGLLIGAGVGLSGSVLPASSARSVKVSDVFSRIA
ncbi:MAG TPA: ABC transporter permease [Planctomycetaceae bacterium]|nr:ABC transporter permease [Planctomycetaceae bacterium]